MDAVAPSAPPHAGPPAHGLIRNLGANAWSVGALAVASLLAAPLIAIFYLAMSPSDDIWSHLVSTVLGHYVRTTILLMIGVGVGTLVIGAGTAWLVTMYRFPGRRVFEWALLLPLAVPAYVIAYVYTDLLEYAGPVQGMLRDVFGWTRPQDYWFPEIRSLGGAISMMTLVLYPYVYLLGRASLTEQSVCVLEVSRTLGSGPWATAMRVALPLARPALVVGVSLALMEALNDFGTVNYFAVATFTAGIYDVWLNMNSTAGAAQLAVVLLMFVLVLIAAERLARRGQRYHHTTSRYRALPNRRLRGLQGWLATLACLAPVGLGFLLPAGMLAIYSASDPTAVTNPDFLSYAFNSIGLATAAAVLALALGIILAYGMRLDGGRVLKAAARFAGAGYAVPGAVLAVGVMIPLTGLDNAIDGFLRRTVGISTGLLLSGTVAAVIFGYVIRFLALTLGTMESALAKITPAIDGAARTLGAGPGRTLKTVHLPMLRGSLLTAGLLVFVDCMKELPMTMLLRPFNFETLATYVHQLASDELLEQAAPGALAIVLAGIVPVILLSSAIRRARPGQSAPR